MRSSLRRDPSSPAGERTCASRRPPAWKRAGPAGPPRRPAPARRQRRRARSRSRLALPGIAAERERLGQSASAASAPRSLQRLPPRSPLPSLADKPPCSGRSPANRASRQHRRLPAAAWQEACAYRQVAALVTVLRAPLSVSGSRNTAPAPHLRRSLKVGRTTPSPRPLIGSLADRCTLRQRTHYLHDLTFLARLQPRSGPRARVGPAAALDGCSAARCRPTESLAGICSTSTVTSSSCS
jgi:hypothetical protein